MKIIKLLTCVLITLCLSKIQAQTVNMLSDTGNVGVGTTSPSTKLEVIGDTKLDGKLEIINEVSVKDSLNVSKKLTVEQDVLIKGKSVFLDEGKFKSDLRVLGTARMKEKLVVDSTANFKDKIVVDGLGRFNGDIKLNGDFIFGNNKRISYLPAIGGYPEIIGFGKGPNVGAGTPCTLPVINVPTINQFGGMLQIWGFSDGNTISGNLNSLNVGYDGANGIIDMKGLYTDGSESGLLINWYCGRDVHINTNPSKAGNVTMTSSTMGMVGIGTTPSTKLDVNGQITMRTGAQDGFIPVSDASGKMTWTNPSTISTASLWLSNSSNIYFNSGNVGIGTDNPLDKFQVGEGFSKINIGFLSGNESSDCISSYLGFNAAKSTNGWVFNSNGTHNGGAIILASNSGQLNFIIKRNPDGGAISNGECVSGTGISDEILDNNQLLERTKMVINQYGNVGIGTNAPTTKLDVNGSIRTNYNQIFLTTDDYHGLGWFQNYAGATIDGPVLYGFSGGALGTNNTGTRKNILIWKEDGSIGIGTDKTAGYKLSVEGKMRAREIEVNVYTWADFVFSEDYQLQPLSEVEKYISQKKHLPNVPSEKEVLAKGINLGEMDSILLQKIEELTLYIIDLEKRLNKFEDKKD